MIEVDYNELKTEIEEIFQGNKEIVLSTCADNRVTSRTICYIYMNQCIYFLTHIRSMKLKQIQKNAQVSLCLRNLQIEGYAEIKGHSFIESNQEIREAFKANHIEFFKRFAHMKSAVIIEVGIRDIKAWKIEDGRDRFYCLDMSKQRAFRKG